MGKTCLLLFASSATGCRRDPPPGSGDVETTPTAKGSGAASPRHDDPPGQKITNFPGGAALVVDAGECSVSMMDGETGLRWRGMLPKCGGIADVVVARDSTAYVRTNYGLHAFSVDGIERWRMAVSANPVPRAIFGPAVTADSLVVVASSTRVAVAFRPDGQEGFRFLLPEDEVLIAAPVGNATEGVLLLSSHAVYALGADGTLRWRRPIGAHAEPPG